MAVKGGSKDPSEEEVGESAGLPIKDLPEGRLMCEFQREAFTERWGFIWDEKSLKEGERVVEKITLGSLAEKGLAHPRPVCPGDRLIQVNGVIGPPMEKLGVELARQKRILCVFIMGPGAGATDLS